MKQLTFKPNLNKSKKYIVAVSGGPDSMALVASLVASKINIVVAHVNYKMRKSADDDQKLVVDFCKKHNIKIFSKVRNENTVGNFQSWAREYRYDFFKEIYIKEKCDALLTAHHQDDKIETFIMKQQRPAIYDSPSLQESNAIKNMNVIRPLLNYKKSDLIDYCNFNKINYNNDETNLDSKYERNRIRNTIIKNMTINTREKYLNEIEIAQKKHEESQLKFSKEYNAILKNNEIDVSLFSSLSNESKVKALYKFIVNSSSIQPNLLSFKRLNNISRQILSAKPNLKVKISDIVFLMKSYNTISITKDSNEIKFEAVLKHITFKKYKEFKISKTGLRLEGVFIDKKDLPLTIRSYQSGDKVVIKNGHKQVSRLFIDAKVAKNERTSIPVVLNAKGEILLVSNYYVNPERKRLQSNVFVIKC